MIDPRVSSLLAEYGIEIIGKSRYPEPRQTRAPETVARILRKRGEDHLRLVLTTLSETSNNHVLLDEVGFWAASDMVLAGKGIIERDAGSWLDLWDAMPVGELQARMQDLAGIVPQRFALGGALYERIHRRFGPNADQLDLLDDRRQP